MTPLVEAAGGCSVKEKKSVSVTRVSEKHGLVYLVMLVLNLKPGENQQQRITSKATEKENQDGGMTQQEIYD